MKGFTLIELLVAMAVFSLVMTVAARAFVAGFGTYRNARIMQKNLEAVQFVMNTMAKELRTSTIKSTTPGPGIIFYDHSQGRCIRYEFPAGAISGGSADMADHTGCTGAFLPSMSTLTADATVNANYEFVDSTPPPAQRIGRFKLVIILTQGPITARVQTTVSLRDYAYAEFF